MGVLAGGFGNDNAFETTVSAARRDPAKKETSLRRASTSTDITQAGKRKAVEDNDDDASAHIRYSTIHAHTKQPYDTITMRASLYIVICHVLYRRSCARMCSADARVAGARRLKYELSVMAQRR